MDGCHIGEQLLLKIKKNNSLRGEFVERGLEEEYDNNNIKIT